MKEKMKRVSIILAATIIMTTMHPIKANAVTPKYKPNMPKIPEINVELNEETKKAIDEAVKKEIEETILDKPEIKTATCIRYKKLNTVSVIWGKVDDATEYKVRITKDDGTFKTYTTNHNWINIFNDEFLTENIEKAEVQVRAWGDNETRSLWSEKGVLKIVNCD